MIKEPDSHWLLTQLGETYYEQRQFQKALGLFLKSRDIVPDCPLTLWHLAGTLDALGYQSGALRLYTWLLESKKTAEDDPCWESKEWTDALKTDCVFRIGICFQHLNRKDKAKSCFRRYADLLLAGPRARIPLKRPCSTCENWGTASRKKSRRRCGRPQTGSHQASGKAKRQPNCRSWTARGCGSYKKRDGSRSAWRNPRCLPSW